MRALVVRAAARRLVRSWRAGLGLAIVALVTVACRTSTDSPLPAPPAKVSVTMLDDRFEYRPEIPAGRVVFQIRNAGRRPHRLVLLPLGEDLPPIDVQLRGTERRSATPFAGINTRQPGQTSGFAVDLVPGRRYAMICFVQEPDGTTHAQKGMAREFRAGGGRPGPTSLT